MKATGPTVSAELRRKHILTLEVCQRLIDENQSLRGDNPPSHSPPPKSRPAIERSEGTSSGLQEALDLLEAKLKASDRRVQMLEVQSEGDRIVLGESRAKSRRLEAEVERLRGLSESQLETIKTLEDTNSNLSATIHRAAEERGQLREATPASTGTAQADGGDEGETDITALSSKTVTSCPKCSCHTRDISKVKAEDARTAADALLQQRDLDALEHAAVLRTAQAENERLRAENNALELEVRRLSVVFQSCTHQEHVMQKQLESRILELTRFQDQQRQSQVAVERTEGPDWRATETDATSQQPSSNNRFAEFAEIQKENQSLRRRISEFEAARARSSGAGAVPAQLPRPLQRSKPGKVALPVFGQPPARR